jgi:hypothetical protein
MTIETDYIEWPFTDEPMVEIMPGTWIRANVPFQVTSSSCGHDVFRTSADAVVTCDSCGTTYRMGRS